MYYKITIFILKREIIKELDRNGLCDSTYDLSIVAYRHGNASYQRQDRQ